MPANTFDRRASASRTAKPREAAVTGVRIGQVLMRKEREARRRDFRRKVSGRIVGFFRRVLIRPGRVLSGWSPVDFAMPNVKETK